GFSLTPDFSPVAKAVENGKPFFNGFRDALKAAEAARAIVAAATGLKPEYVFSVAQTSESAVSQVSKPAARSIQKDAPAARDAQPTVKSAIQQTRRSALRQGAPTLNRYEARC